MPTKKVDSGSNAFSRPLTPQDSWLRGDQLVLPSQHLDPPEVEAFLRFLFGNIAQRPGPLLLRESAGVARYLNLLAWKGVPRTVVAGGQKALKTYYESPERVTHVKERKVLERLAWEIWGSLLQFGRIKPCTKTKAQYFLRNHRRTYLAGNSLLEPALAIIQDFVIPPRRPNEPPPFQPPNFMSRTLSPQGSGNPRLRDDLSERIAAGFYALKRSKLREVRESLADALTTAGVPRRSPASKWTYVSVNERIKEYESQLREELRRVAGKDSFAGLLQRSRDRLADKWISLYREGLSSPVRVELMTRHAGWYCFDCGHMMSASDAAPPPVKCPQCSRQRMAALTANLILKTPSGGGTAGSD